MADFYDEMAALATELLGPDEFGEELTIKRETGEVVDEISGVVTTPATDATYNPLGVILDYKQGMIDNERILVGDRYLIIDNSTEPLMSDRPVVAGEEWSIIRWVKLGPRESSVTAAYLVQVRG